MFYPLIFKPVFKDYIWGGRNLEKMNKVLPDGIVAESWELSCHSDGQSVIANGEFAGQSLTDLISKYGDKIVGSELPDSDAQKFPLLIKFIDANDKLSVQVHPEDSYAKLHENGELGKNEMWYILDAKPGARLVYNVIAGTTKETFAKAINDGTMGDFLNYVEVQAGDFLNIPAGLVHAIGEGIVLAEVQQNSNTTYRVFDYDRVDKNGIKRPLHINKALDVIDFENTSRKEKAVGLEIKLSDSCTKNIKIANNYFAIELYDVNEIVYEEADGTKFYIFIITEGLCSIDFDEGRLDLKKGDTVLIPASLGKYSLHGEFKAIKSYVPDLNKDILDVLLKNGYTKEEILAKVEGLI